MQDFDDLDKDQVRLDPPAGRASLTGVLYYPDILDLRLAGYELERFEGLLLALDQASYRNALRVSRMLRISEATPIWNAKRADQIELLVLDSIHEYGLAQVPQLLRRVLGRVFEDDTKNYLTIDLVTVFYWACLAQVAQDYAWRDPRLIEWAEYLSYPVRAVFGLADQFQKAN
jgi:hypothetical protein